MNTNGQERELYDYSSANGLLELDNLAARSPLEPALDAQLASAIHSELREPVPRRLLAAQQDGYADYFTTAKASALVAATQRRKLEEGEPPGKAVEKLGQP